MARKLANWLKGYQEYTEGTESPPAFHLWVALGTIAGAAQRKIILDAGYYQVHTNMFLILVAPPGKSRKSTALRIGKGILRGILDYGQDVHFSTQASSAAALIKQLCSIKTKEHQSLTAFSSELGSLLGSKSVEMTDFLVDIYDCDPDWDKQTIARGLEKVEKPWLNIVAATTPQWMGDNLSQTAIEGGFVARTLFIYEESRLRVAFPELTDEQRTIRKALIHDLAIIGKLEGEFQFPPEAKEFYRAWYENPVRGTEQTDMRLGGYYERKHAHVLKVAMALSLAQKDELVLTVDDIGMAIDMLTELEPGMRRAFSGVGKNIFSNDLERIKSQIITQPKGVHYKKLLAGNIHAVEKDMIDKLLNSLCDMGDVRREGLVFFPNHTTGG